MARPRGVIDAVLTDTPSPVTVATEFVSQIRRLEQLLRWTNEKADGLASQLAVPGPGSHARDVSRLLVARSTVATREIATRYHDTLLTAYPARAATVFDALTTPGAPWPGAGIVWMTLHGSRVTLMRLPPPRVELGR